MKPLLLPFALGLAAMGLVGMLGARQGVAGESAPMPVVERGDHTIPIFDRYSPTAVQQPDWIPTPEPGVVLAPGETVQVMPLHVWRASLVIAEEYRYELVRACFCESRWQTNARGAAGEEGACQVIPRFHGPVPSDLRGQFAQASRIAEQHGMGPWTTKAGCEGWNAE